MDPMIDTKTRENGIRNEPKSLSKHHPKFTPDKNQRQVNKITWHHTFFELEAKMAQAARPSRVPGSKTTQRAPGELRERPKTAPGEAQVSPRESSKSLREAQESQRSSW